MYSPWGHSASLQGPSDTQGNPISPSLYFVFYFQSPSGITWPHRLFYALGFPFLMLTLVVSFLPLPGLI